MRFAYVCADAGVPVFGRKGCSVHVQEVIRAMTGLGASVELIAARLGGERPAGLEAVECRALPSISTSDSAARERGALAANRDLHAVLERGGPFDLVYERYSLWSHAAMEYAEAAGAVGVLEVNAPLIQEQAEHRGLVNRAGAERIAARAFQAAFLLVAVSTEVAAYLEQEFPSTRGRVHLVPNGVSAGRFRSGVAPACAAPAGGFTVGFLGSLKPWHGLPLLAAAFDTLYRSAPGARLLIVGDGPERAALMEQLSAYGLADATHFAGAVAPSEVPGLLASMDVGVAPYETGRCYFSPLKVYEYMAAGLPVVASRVGQPAELVRDGETGFLCAPGDPAALAHALDRLRRDPELRARMGAAGRAQVLRDHTWESRVSDVLALAGLTPQPGPRPTAVGA